jgi:asparagine synthase (glutamine-hydrolysing)
MGAICGYAGHGDGELLDRLLGRLAHRGRGGAGKLAGVGFGLAENHAGDPAARVRASADGRVVAVIDGSLLNRAALREALDGAGVAARAGDDAEIVADGFMTWGEALFPKLDGAFTAAIHAGDAIYLARDALGEKALYYTEQKGTLLFASESKAFLAHDGFVVEPDAGSLVKLLVFSFIPGSASMFRGVHELLPGTFLRWSGPGTARAVTYWDVAEEIPDAGEEHFVRTIRSLSSAAVDRRLPPAGTRVGAFLSGGVDSSAVVALLRARGVDVTAYSVAFGHGQPNEIMYARLVTEHCHVPHRVLDIEPDMFIDLLPQVIYNLDDPLCDCITVPNYLLAREAAREHTIVFNGEGGDPLFGGPKNKFMILGEWYRPFGGYDRLRAYLSSYHKLYDYLGDLCTPALLAQTGGTKPLEDEVRPYLEDGDMTHFLNRLMRINIKLKGGQSILVKVEKMLSANGVEGRSPLFDRALAEFSFAIPPAYKRRGDVEKYAFKKAIEDLLPRPVVYRKKAGMGVPLNHWFRATRLKDYTADLLLDRRATDRGYFQRGFVEDLLAGKGPAYAVGQDRSGELIWMLLAIELWHRVFVDAGGKP